LQLLCSFPSPACYQELLPRLYCTVKSCVVL
jgi:hypothetical protein